MRASHQHVVPAPLFFLSRPGCFRRPVRGPNLLSVYCQPSLLSWEGLFKRDRRRGGGKDTRLPSELTALGCVKAEGRRVGLSHATSLRTSEWPSARRIWREREERESVREGERRRRHRRSAASVASNQPSPPSNVCSIHARKREGPDTDGRRDGKRARPSSGELQNFKLHSGLSLKSCSDFTFQYVSGMRDVRFIQGDHGGLRPGLR